MKALKTMFEHGPVDFFEHGEADLDAVGGIHADDVTIERRVMQLAEREPVRDARLAFGIAVGDDVRSF